MTEAVSDEIPPASPDTTPAPVLILASREAGGSLLSGLLGAHADFVAAPHLNLLAFDAPWQLVKYSTIPRDSNLHGLLRFLAMALTGEESVSAIQAAQRWLARRDKAPVAEVHAEMRALVAPARLIDVSPLLLLEPSAVGRALARVPQAHVIHLTRHPWSQAAALAKPVLESAKLSLDFWDRRGTYQPPLDVFEIGEQYVDWSATPPVFDPQFAWSRAQRAAGAARAAHDPGRWIHLRLEDLVARPQATLSQLFAALGHPVTMDDCAAVLSAPPPHFFATGPYNAPFGMDRGVVGHDLASALAAARNGALPPKKARKRLPRTPLPWRGDGETFLEPVAALARDYGYDLAG